jgi:hypothetical protein
VILFFDWVVRHRIVGTAEIFASAVTLVGIMVHLAAIRHDERVLMVFGLDLELQITGTSAHHQGGRQAHQWKLHVH